MKKNYFLFLLSTLVFLAKAQCPPVTGFEICGITSDTSGTHNIVIWDKTGFAQVDTFLIQRETTPGVYTTVGKVPYDSLSWFHDYGANPSVSDFKYKMGVIDTCGNLTDTITPYHRSLFFFSSGNGTFGWNGYWIEGTNVPVSLYALDRDSLSNGIWDSIATTAGSQLVLNDINWSNQLYARWRVRIHWNRVCVPAFKTAHPGQVQNMAANPISNMSYDRFTGIKNTNNKNKFVLFPNPAADVITIRSSTGLESATIYNCLGEIVLQIKNKNKQEQIDVSKFPVGIYTIVAEGMHGKFIKE